MILEKNHFTLDIVDFKIKIDLVKYEWSLEPFKIGGAISDKGDAGELAVNLNELE